MRIPVFMVLASVLCGGVLAATVPQRSAEDYFFSRPNLPSNILGTVMGDPPAYHVPRSEDVAWLREAWAERVALAGGSPFGNSWTGVLADVVVEVPEFGRWPMSETNRFTKWTTDTFLEGENVVTNVVAGYSVVTNKGGGVDTPTIRGVNPWSGLEAHLVANTNDAANGYLSLSNGLYLSAAVARKLETVTYTNIFDRTVWFDAWTNGTNFVSMSMTNGTTSVFTNAWRVYAPTSAVQRITNVTMAAYLGIPAIFKDGAVHGLGRPLPPPLGGILATAGITNHYASLRLASRLAKETSATNKVFDTAYGGYDTTSGDVTVRTNRLLAALRVYRDCSQGAHDAYYPVWGEDQDETDPPARWEHESGGSGRQVFEAGSGASQTFRIKMSGFAAAPDGQRLSIRSARAFAEVSLSFEESSNAWNGHGVDNEYDTNIVRQAMVPLGSVTPSLDVNGELSFTLNVSLGVLQSAWDASDIPVGLPMSNTYLPPLRFSCPPGGHGAMAGSQWAGNTGTRMVFEAEMGDVFVLLDLAPRASLPGWND